MFFFHFFFDVSRIGRAGRLGRAVIKKKVMSSREARIGAGGRLRRAVIQKKGHELVRGSDKSRESVSEEQL